ncbi:thermonuclease family protein [Breoghania sp. JC706]|uniref:thermonuclease family protein n=1 Tax=Breoghania sp. JC706 TaxID=3117732 RepID=UPI00300B2465
MRRPTFVALLLMGLALPGSAYAADIRGRVTHIVDGDTFDIGATRIRVCGIDAPERDTRKGKKATQVIRTMIAGRQIRCVVVGSGTPCDGRSRAESYGRVVAQCFVGGHDIAAEMVRRGAARDWKRYSGGYYRR